MAKRRELLQANLIAAHDQGRLSAAASQKPDYHAPTDLNQDLNGGCLNSLTVMYLSGATVGYKGMMDDAVRGLHLTTVKLGSYLERTPMERLRTLDLSQLYRPLQNALTLMFGYGSQMVLGGLRTAMAQLIDRTMLWLVHNYGFTQAFQTDWFPCLWAHIMQDQHLLFGKTTLVDQNQSQRLRSGEQNPVPEDATRVPPVNSNLDATHGAPSEETAASQAAGSSSDRTSRNGNVDNDTTKVNTKANIKVHHNKKDRRAYRYTDNVNLYHGHVRKLPNSNKTRRAHSDNVDVEYNEDASNQE
ncbi:hypothetical protein N0V88_004847 [Collariella sp. IMI 366227]|nr:hypothetical protein N0V88_004847 [Collariella sp. IMI 366227]